MSRSSRRLVLALVTFAVLLALTVGPAAEGTPTTTFLSNHYGYSLGLAGAPGHYLLTQASTTWSGSSPSPSDPAFDQIDDLKTHSAYMFAAKRLPTRWTLRKWMSFTRSISAPPCTYRPGTLTRTSLDGAPALVYELKCAAGLVFQLAAVHADRGYLVVYTADAPNRKAFVATLGSFHFPGD